MIFRLSNEVKIGLIVLTGIVLLIWGINFLKGSDIFAKQKVFYAVYDRVDGLALSSPVQINGLKVGQIDALSILPGSKGKVVARMSVKGKVDVPSDSRAVIISVDLLGTKAVDLNLGSGPPAQNGDTLAAELQMTISQMVNKQVAPITKKTENLLESLDSALSIVHAVFNKETQVNLVKTFENLQATVSSLEHASFKLDTLVSTEQRKIRNILTNVESISLNLKKNNDKISQAINNFANLSDTLVKAKITSTINRANEILNSTSVIFDKINKGEGSMGMLINNDSLYNNLTTAVENLDKLIIDINENPRRYLNLSFISIGSGKKKSKDKKTATDPSISIK